MGLILGRFRKKKTTFEQLEKIDSDIKSIEAFRLNTEIAQRKIVGQFILVSAGIYILVAVVFYFYFFPATFYDQIFYITPLLLVPFIIWGVKRLLTWYYKRKISKNETKLSTLRTEKKKLLDHVMDTETYKVAKTILEKFAPEQIRKTPTSYEATTPFKPSITSSATTLATPTTIRNRLTTVKQPSNFPKTPNNTQLIRSRAMSTPSVAGPNTNGSGQAPGENSAMVVRQPNITPIPLPREILPRDRSVLDKMVEYLVGDGPSNRYALICRNCQSHNGMALREEFEYFAFRCCYCYYFNPARKLRPSAPKLEFESSSPSIQNRRRNSSSTSSSEKNSEPDSEQDDKDKEQEKPEDLKNETTKIPETPEDVPMEVDELQSQQQEDIVVEKTEIEKKDD